MYVCVCVCVRVSLCFVFVLMFCHEVRDTAQLQNSPRFPSKWGDSAAGAHCRHLLTFVSRGRDWRAILQILLRQHPSVLFLQDTLQLLLSVTACLTDCLNANTL